MNPWIRRRAIQAIGIVLIVVLVFAVWRGRQILAIGVAYKAKMLCSGTFNARSCETYSAFLIRSNNERIPILRHRATAG
jgi:hypothetical protein